MIPIIIIIISLILDGLLTNFLPFLVNDLSYFTPLLTVVSLLVIYPFYKKKENTYLVTLFIVGLIYDLLYTNLLFLNAILFVIIGIIIKKIYKNFEVDSFKLILYTIIIISAYEVISASFFFIYNTSPVTIFKVIYKITHTLILNIIYNEILYLIIKLLPKKYKQISIN